MAVNMLLVSIAFVTVHEKEPTNIKVKYESNLMYVMHDDGESFKEIEAAINDLCSEKQ